MHEPGEWNWARRANGRVWHLVPAVGRVQGYVRPPCGAADVAVVPAWDNSALLAGDAELCRTCLHAALRGERAMARARS